MKKNSIEVIQPGTQVLLNKNIEATIDRVIITPQSYAYSVIWWNGRERKEAIVYDYEIVEKMDLPKTTIGFI